MKEILKLIADPEYRTFLEGQNLSALTYSQILRRAQIPLKEKLPLMLELFARKNTTDPKEIEQLARDLNELERAIKGMDSEDMAVCYELTQYWLQDYTAENLPNRYYQHFLFYDCQHITDLFHTLDQAIGRIRCTRGKSPRAAIIRRDEYGKPMIYYAATQHGVVWGYSSTMEVWDDCSIYIPPLIPPLHLPHPYKPGDIITVDMEPFRPRQHYLILNIKHEKHNGSPLTNMLYLNEKGHIAHDVLEQLNEECDLLTPFLRLARCTETLTGKEAFLSEMAESIRKAPELAQLYRKSHICAENDPAAAARKIAEDYFREHLDMEKRGGMECSAAFSG